MKGRRAITFGPAGSGEAPPPGPRRGALVEAEDAEVAPRPGHGLDHRSGALVGEIGHREAEMEACGIAHRRVAGRDVRVNGVGRLDVGEGPDDDAPDALDGVEGQKAAMAVRERAHHRSLAARAEGGAGFGGALGGDERADDGAALHQEAVHGLVDPVDVAAQILEGGSGHAAGPRAPPLSQHEGPMPSLKRCLRR